MSIRALPEDGLERYTTRRVNFVYPFTLGAAPEVYPAGEYDVEAREQAIERAGHIAHVRTSTILIIRTSAATSSREVRGSELDHALLHDAQRAGQCEPSENPDRGGVGEHGAPNVGSSQHEAQVV